MSAELVVEAEVVPVIDHDSAVELDGRITDLGEESCDLFVSQLENRAAELRVEESV